MPESTFTILIVDDDADDIDIFLCALGETGFKVNHLIAADGITALNMVQNLDSLPDLIFLDMNMPRMGGLECLKKLRSIKGCETLPVIIYTTSSFPGEQEKLFQAGASHYLTKEFSLDKIAQQITHLLEKYAPEQLRPAVDSKIV